MTTDTHYTDLEQRMLELAPMGIVERDTLTLVEHAAHVDGVSGSAPDDDEIDDPGASLADI